VGTGTHISTKPKNLLFDYFQKKLQILDFESYWEMVSGPLISSEIAFPSLLPHLSSINMSYLSSCGCHGIQMM
jgi:hypothetical protein